MARGRSKMKRLQRGQTIVAERERVETDSERLMARKKAHHKQMATLGLVALMLAVLGLGFYLGMKQIARANLDPQIVEKPYQIRAEILDEDNRGQISSRVRTYIGQLEQDLLELNYIVSRVTLPTGMSRTLYVDLDGEETYFKVNIDRNTALVAEDIDRIVRYLVEHDLHPGYVDLRVEGKAYYQ